MDFKVKQFDFIKFSKWFNHFDPSLSEFKQMIGNYTAEISVFSYNLNSLTFTALLKFTEISSDMSINTSILKQYNFEFFGDKCNIEDLRTWYDDVCAQLNFDFKNDIMKTYIE